MGERCFVIAEAGVNHNGSLELAQRMAEVAKQCGADAVKFQTFRAESLVTAAAAKAEYQREASGSHEGQRDMLRGLELSFAEFEELSSFCGGIGIEFMSTPFDTKSAEFLDRLGMGRFKIPSGEITHRQLIERIAGFGKPVILSTGMSSLEEVERAVSWIQGVQSEAALWLLHCVSAYPAQPSDVNLAAMGTIRERLGLPVGLSDHTVGVSVALGAAALGAVAIEKHFTLDRSMKGPDHRSSLEPGELAAMVSGIREIEAAMGDGRKVAVQAELDVTFAARRSVVTARELPRGSVLAIADFEFKRPGSGIEPWRASELVGRILRVDLPRDVAIEWEMLE